MREATAVVTDPGSQYIKLPSELTLDPTRWGWAAVGGPDAAEIAVRGPVGLLHHVLNALGFDVLIRNESAQDVWWGFIYEVEVSLGGVIVNMGLENTFNRIAVNYVQQNIDGTETSGRTAWADDLTSQGRYGVRELMLSFEGSEADAITYRNAKLVEHRHPRPSIVPQRAEPGATIYCQGYWHRLGWQYYEDHAGLVENNSVGAGELLLGATYTATTISFVAQDDLFDTAGLLPQGFNALAVGDRFWVSGAANGANNGEFTLKSKELSGSDGHIETVDKDRVTEAAGATITLSRSEQRVDRVAQSFTLAEDVDDWTVAVIGVRVGKTGSPSDNLICELRADSAGSPGALLDSASIAGSALPERVTWVEFTLANTQTLTFGTTYWIVLRRSGSNSLGSYYTVDANEDADYSGGVCKVHTGSAYTNPLVAVDVPFRVKGKNETTVQLARMIASNAAFAAANVIVRDASGVDTEQYRDGDQITLDEIEDLLELGTSAGERLIATVMHSENTVVVRKQPEAAATAYRLNADGSLSQPIGGQVAPLGHGIDVSGEWLRVNIHPLVDVLGTRAIFAERAEYSAEDDFTRVETDASRRVWDFGKVKPG